MSGNEMMEVSLELVKRKLLVRRKNMKNAWRMRKKEER